MTTKEDKLEAENSLKESLNHCSVVICSYVYGRPTNTGRTDYLNIIGLDKDNNKLWLNGLYCKAKGYRLSKDEYIIMNGCGYSKAHHIYVDLNILLNRDYREHQQNINPKIIHE